MIITRSAPVVASTLSATSVCKHNGGSLQAFAATMEGEEKPMRRSRASSVVVVER